MSATTCACVTGGICWRCCGPEASVELPPAKVGPPMWNESAPLLPTETQGLPGVVLPRPALDDEADGLPEPVTDPVTTFGDDPAAYEAALLQEEIEGRG